MKLRIEPVAIILESNQIEREGMGTQLESIGIKARMQIKVIILREIRKIQRERLILAILPQKLQKKI